MTIELFRLLCPKSPGQTVLGIPPIVGQSCICFNGRKLLPLHPHLRTSNPLSHQHKRQEIAQFEEQGTKCSAALTSKRDSDKKTKKKA
jgi:hypothetical protein